MKFEDIKKSALNAAKVTEGHAVEISSEEMDLVGGGAAAMLPPTDSRFANATWTKSF